MGFGAHTIHGVGQPKVTNRIGEGKRSTSAGMAERAFIRTVTSIGVEQESTAPVGTDVQNGIQSTDMIFPKPQSLHLPDLPSGQALIVLERRLGE